MISLSNASNPTRISGLALWAPAFLLCFLSVGCFRAPDVKDLEARARQYMQERQKRDWSAVYDEFMDPKVRSDQPKRDFLRRRGGAFDLLSFSIESATIDPSAKPISGRVVVRMEAVIPLLAPNGGSQTVRREISDPQIWVVRDGIWYVRLKR